MRGETKFPEIEVDDSGSNYVVQLQTENQYLRALVTRLTGGAEVHALDVSSFTKDLSAKQEEILENAQPRPARYESFATARARIERKLREKKQEMAAEK